MKKILFAVLILSCSFRVFADNTPEKVLNAFNKTFPNVQEVSWINQSTSYEANFKQDQISLRIVYDQEGNIVRTIRSYFEDHLPIFILSRVKNRFSDKKIFGVTEVASENGTEYYITLEDEKNWTDIKADNFGTITIQKKFKKAQG